MATKKTTKTKKVTPKADLDQTTTLSEVNKSGNNLTTRVPNFIKSGKSKVIVISLAVLVILLFLLSKYLVVAWVDKKPITRFEYFQALDKKYGNDIREQLIVEKLVNDEAKNRGVNVSASEIQDEEKKIETDQGGADQLNQILQMQGISKDEFNNLVRLQILKQKMFSKDVNITDADVTKYFEDNKQALTDENGQTVAVPTQKMKDSAKEQLKSTKINENFNTWLREALQSSRVARI